jgi:hypothetical protein
MNNVLSKEVRLGIIENSIFDTKYTRFLPLLHTASASASGLPDPAPLGEVLINNIMDAGDADVNEPLRCRRHCRHLLVTVRT